MLEELKKDLCACGIGLGTSASEAEFNAVVALRQAKESGFGNWFAERCKAAGVPGRAHGLRKAAARRLSDAGATQQEIKAWGGWSNDAEVALYVAGADRARLADQSASSPGSRAVGNPVEPESRKNPSAST